MLKVLFMLAVFSSIVSLACSTLLRLGRKLVGDDYIESGWDNQRSVYLAKTLPLIAVTLCLCVALMKILLGRG